MKFTYGFELEGVISKELGEKLSGKLFKNAEDLRMNHRKYFHQDGSVRVRPPGGMNCFRIKDSGCTCGSCESFSTEFSSPVYSTFNSMIKQMAMFEDEKHFKWDWSCGLHLSIGVTDVPKPVFFAALTNYDFLKQLRNNALKYCSHQKHRLNNSTGYYNFYGSRRALITDAKKGEKYRLIRFHPNGHAECRFLCPCEHKEVNVTKTVEYITDYLSSKTVKHFGIRLPDYDKPEKPLILKRVINYNALSKVNLGRVMGPYQLPPRSVYLNLETCQWVTTLSIKSLVTGEIFKPGSVVHKNVESAMFQEIKTQVRYYHDNPGGIPPNWPDIERYLADNIFSRYSVVEDIPQEQLEGRHVSFKRKVKIAGLKATHPVRERLHVDTSPNSARVQAVPDLRWEGPELGDEDPTPRFQRQRVGQRVNRPRAYGTTQSRPSSPVDYL